MTLEPGELISKVIAAAIVGLIFGLWGSIGKEHRSLLDSAKPRKESACQKAKSFPGLLAS